VKFQTVTGPVPVEDVGLADGHAHAWIEPPEGVAPEARLILDDYDAIRAELSDFRTAGGTTLVDCQPGGCGRDAQKLVRLAQATGLHITATTGFHRQRYYPPESWLWSAPADEATAYFVEELTAGMRETDGAICATTIKVGYEGNFEGQGRVLMEAAAEASHQTGALILFHTDQGRNVEALLPFFADRGIPPTRMYLCHVDKRPDLGLHRELARAGVLLGYDTFVRPRYNPEHTAWRLVKAMVAEGLEDHVAVGLDLAVASMWRHYGGQPGMLALPQQIVPRLRAEDIPEVAVRKLAGQNIARYLARQYDNRGHEGDRQEYFSFTTFKHKGSTHNGSF
jgi:predicted metal-dependent phosphotriesterase family hydrolase